MLAVLALVAARRVAVNGFTNPIQRLRPQSHPTMPHYMSSFDYGTGLDQEAMMESDMLVVVDENDVLVEGAVVSKKKAHEFTQEQPRGIAHRAFSIFLFNQDGRMLLTRRADSKITFPGVRVLCLLLCCVVASRGMNDASECFFHQSTYSYHQPLSL